MSWKRSLAEMGVRSAAVFVSRAAKPPNRPRSIFVLRNNDIGDLLVVTPLFEALHRRFPNADIVAGVGSWNVPIVLGNPYVSDVMVVSAPWHNRVTGTRDPRAALQYLVRSREVRDLRARRFAVGIDILGSPFGSLLLMRAGIPWRLGVRGYAGGHTAAQACVQHDPAEHVGRAALRFAELLGASWLPGLRPQVFLSEAEIDDAERTWRRHGLESGQRIVIVPGGGHPGRAWPVDSFDELARLLSLDRGARQVVVGADGDAAAASRIAAHGALNLAGRLSLRQSMAVISCADVVYCNSSFAMHAAAAFAVPAIVLLGHAYESADLHAAQWGHDGLTLILGRGADRSDVYHPAEVVGAAQAWLAAKQRGARRVH